MNNLIVVIIFLATALGLTALGLGGFMYIQGGPPAVAGRRAVRSTPVTPIRDPKDQQLPM